MFHYCDSLQTFIISSWFFYRNFYEQYISSEQNNYLLVKHRQPQQHKSVIIETQINGEGAEYRGEFYSLPLSHIIDFFSEA